MGKGTNGTQGSGAFMEFLLKNALQSASTQTYALPCRECWPVLGQQLGFYLEFWLGIVDNDQHEKQRRS